MKTEGKSGQESSPCTPNPIAHPPSVQRFDASRVHHDFLPAFAGAFLDLWLDFSANLACNLFFSSDGVDADLGRSR